MRFMLGFILSLQTITMPSSVNSEDNCTALRDIFANSTSQFISCTIQHSRPITMCQNCVFPYMQIMETYKNMKQFVDNDTHCLDKFINLDRLQIVQTLYENSYNLWHRAKCYECFELVDGNLTPNQSIETVTFDNLYQNFNSCISQPTINDTNICATCMKTYVDLDTYYVSISNENEKIGVCMDIVDMMNTTRSFWSWKCCKFRKHPEYIFLASTITVLIVSLCFYVGAQFCSIKNAPTIIQQTRFAESLTQVGR